MDQFIRDSTVKIIETKTTVEVKVIENMRGGEATEKLSIFLWKLRSIII